MTERSERCLNCEKRIAPYPEDFWDIGHDITGYVCWGCQSVEALQVYRNILRKAGHKVAKMPRKYKGPLNGSW
jgi:hypothetical protein